MKKFFAALIAVAAIFSLAADDVLIWKPDFTKYNKKNSGTGLWCDKALGVEGKAEYFKDRLRLTILKNPAKSSMAAQGLILYTGKFEKGVKYEISFKIRSNNNVRIWASAAMSQPPWKAFKGEYVTLEANDEEDEDIEFVIPASYDGKTFRALFLGLGNAPEGTVFDIYDVKLTQDTDN